MNNILALVGMAGSGKTEATKFIAKKDYSEVHFGAFTIEEIKKQGLAINEKNEKRIRESLRERYGMAAFAKLNVPKIDKLIKNKDVVIDGLYSWEEYVYLKKKFAEKLKILAMFTSKDIRIKRLNKRKKRPLSKSEMLQRDKAEILNINKAGPIAIADYTIINNGTLNQLRLNINKLLKSIKR